jgi:chemotaxis signal transduction protein
MESKRSAKGISISSLGIIVEREEQIVSIPKHTIIEADGTDTGTLCASVQGVVHIRNSFPYRTAYVQCIRANQIGVTQCVKTWTS